MTHTITSTDVITGNAQGRLTTIVERIERLEQDKAAIAEDLKEVYSEAKGEGFDVKILRKVVALRKKDKVKLDEENALIELYMEAIGSSWQDPLIDTPASRKSKPPAAPVERVSIEEAIATVAPSDEELYQKAITIVRTGKTSTSHVQRQLQIGYNRAADLMERMEREGIITPANHVGKREVISA